MRSRHLSFRPRMLDTSGHILCWRETVLPKVVLYVKSVKTIVGQQTETVRYVNYGAGRQIKEVIYDFVLPEDQQRIVDMVRSIGPRLLLDVEIIDVAKENVLRRITQEERERISVFPTLVAEKGNRFEGEMTEEKVESFLFHIANEGQKKYL